LLAWKFERAAAVTIIDLPEPTQEPTEAIPHINNVASLVYSKYPPAPFHGFCCRTLPQLAERRAFWSVRYKGKGLCFGLCDLPMCMAAKHRQSKCFKFTYLDTLWKY